MPKLPPAQVLQVRFPMQLRSRPSPRFSAQEAEVNAEDGGGISRILNVVELQEKPPQFFVISSA